MRLTTVCGAMALAGFIAVAAGAAEPDALDEMVAASDRQAPQELARLQYQLQALHRDKLSSAERKEKGEVIRARIKAVREKRVYLPSPMPRVFNVGDVGTIESFRVTQVVDDKTVLVEIDYLQSKPLAMIKGRSTAGMVDDARFAPKGTFQVTEPQQYTNLIGATRTVIGLKPFDAEPIERFLNARAEVKRLGGKDAAKKAAAAK